MSDFRPLIYKTTDGVYKEYGENFLDGMFDFPENTTDVLQWGDIEWGPMIDTFKDNKFITSFSATDTPNTRNNKTMIGVFAGSTNFNGDINDWDVSNVRTMMGVFDGATSFNRPLKNWDVSNVIRMESLFREAVAFNQPLDKWDVSNVTDMKNMFMGATSFNQNITNWDVSNVENMDGMFALALRFNQDLSNWDLSSLISALYLGYFALSFNPDNEFSLENFRRFREDKKNYPGDEFSIQFTKSAIHQTKKDVTYDLMGFDVETVMDWGERSKVCPFFPGNAVKCERSCNLLKKVFSK